MTSATAIRLIIPVVTVLGAIVGAIVGVTKLVPERAKLILGYQVEAIGSLQAENKRLLETIARLEIRVEELEKKLEKDS